MSGTVQVLCCCHRRYGISNFRPDSWYVMHPGYGVHTSGASMSLSWIVGANYVMPCIQSSRKAFAVWSRLLSVEYLPGKRLRVPYKCYCHQYFTVSCENGKYGIGYFAGRAQGLGLQAVGWKHTAAHGRQGLLFGEIRSWQMTLKYISRWTVLSK